MFVYTSLFSSSLNITKSRAHSHSLCIMSLLVLIVLLHVSAYEDIIRQYTLTFIMDYYLLQPDIQQSQTQNKKTDKLTKEKARLKKHRTK
jgi:hypothetical protein